MGALIDDLIPKAEIAMRHTRFIPASPARVYAALRTADFGRSPLVRLLLAVRSIPGWLIQPREARRRLDGVPPGFPLTLQHLTEVGFGLVGERSGEEIVLGVVGRFWKASGELRPADPGQFRYGPPVGEALVAWNFTVAAAAGGTLLKTETRIVADPAVFPTFQRYWFVVRPGSGLIRRAMLAAVAREVLSARP